jgi:Mrp family chromosome partitioning ATPase
VAASLAAALARAGQRVIVVDADLRRPALSTYLGADTDGPGLTDVLQARVALEEALVRVEPIPVTSNSHNGHGPADEEHEEGRQGQLEVLPAGRTNSLAGNVLTPEALAVLIERMDEYADYIVLDAPPLLVADALGLALLADNVLLVARRGRTTRDQAEWARTTLQGLGVEKISVVLTNAPPVETYA